MDSIFSKKKVKNNEDEEGSGVTAILDVFGNGQVGSPETRVSINVNFSELSTGCPIRSETWLGRHRFHCTVLPRCPINSDWADGGTYKIKVNPTQVSDRLENPVESLCFSLNQEIERFGLENHYSKVVLPKYLLAT